MKKTISMILCLALASFSCGAVQAENEKVTVLLDGNEIVFPDAQPFIDTRDRTLVPIRFVSEAMSADVDWDDESKTVTIQKDKDVVKYTIHSTVAYLNDQLMSFDSFGILKEDRTFVPIRFISELLGCDVDWNDTSRIVTITSPGPVEKFPEPEITVNYPESEWDKRLLWITLDNYRDFERECPNYEFKIEFISPAEFNVFEQDDGAINGWQMYNRDNFRKLSILSGEITSIIRANYTTRELKETLKLYEGMEMQFKLTVRRNCSGEEKEYLYTEKLELPYPVEG